MQTMFDQRTGSPRALARNSDPAPSHLAARRVNQSGQAARQREICLRAVRHWPGRTSAELAQLVALEWPAEIKLHAGSTGLFTCRRLPELRTLGQVANGNKRICSVVGSVCQTWLPTSLF